MNFRNMEYFVAISEENSISKAAERLYVSQQSLSEQLKKLEDEVGVTLVKRGRPLTLTPEGKVFLRAATEILGTYNEMLDEIAVISEKDRAKIILAIPETETPPFLAGLLTEFALEHPEFEVEIIQCGAKEAAKCAGDFDLYFSTLPLGPELVNVPILEGDTYAVAFSSGLAKRIYGERWPEVEAQLLEKRDIYVLRDMPFISLRNKVNDVVLDRQIIFDKAGFVPNVVFQSENGELNANMCKMGAGAYVATMAACRCRFCDDIGKSDGILLYPIDTGIDPIMIALSHRKGMHLTKADKCFISTAKRYLKNSSVTHDHSIE